MIIALLLAAYLSWFAGNYFSQREIKCSARIGKVLDTTRTGQGDIGHGNFDIDMKNDSLDYKLYNTAGALVRSGFGSFTPGVDWSGKIKSITIDTVHEAALGQNQRRPLYGGITVGHRYPFVFENIDEDIAWVQVGIVPLFCTVP
ncbi:hypothetical protein ABD440_24435 [Chromobacterium piscinae]